MIIVNYCVLYLKDAKGIGLKYSCWKKKKVIMCHDGHDGCVTNTKVVNILWYVSIESTGCTP